MNLNKREFLGGLLAVTGAVSVGGISLATIPKLYGDGVHDDGPALSSLLNGEPTDVGGVITVNKGGVVHLKAGTYRIESTVVTNRDDMELDCGGAKLRIPYDLEVWFDASAAKNCTLQNAHIVSEQHPFVTVGYEAPEGHLFNRLFKGIK